MLKSSEPSSQNVSPSKKAFNYLKEILTSPYGVAAIASLSFHGVLFAAIPRFSSASFAAFSDDNISEETRTVPLVTLSPAEQGRLPNFNQPKLPSIPRITTPTSPRSLPTLPKSPLFSSPSSRLSTLPSIGSTSRLNSNSRLNRNRPFRNPYIPRPRLPITNTPSRSAQSSERRNTPVTNIPVPPSVGRSDLTDEEILKRQQQLEEQQVAEQPGGDESVPGLSELPEQSASSETDNVAVNSVPEEQLSRLARLQAKFQYVDEDTSQEEVEENYAAWETEINEAVEGSVETAEKLELIVESGFSLCVAQPPTTGEIGILVAPDGTASNSVVLRSTGYEHINQSALESLLEGEYPESETSTRYLFDLLVAYDSDACKTGDDILETAQTQESLTDETADEPPSEE
ncbi:MAG: hypothetical protein AAF821_00550 [Cyanobacteria bacterium P01_D01_bin.156]